MTHFVERLLLQRLDPGRSDELRAFFLAASWEAKKGGRGSDER